MIETKHLSFRYGKNLALNNVSLAFPVGFNILLGPNGAGKSTLVSLLTHLALPIKGDITFDGRPLNQDTADIMANFGVVFQQATLDLDLSVKQNLIYHGALHGLSPAIVLAQSKPLIERLELDKRLNDKVRSLNGGHRRRVEIVRALVHQPRYLLLDEPSVGLDNHSRNIIINYIRELTDTMKLTVIWTTHLLDEIAQDDQLHILKQGEVIASAQLNALLNEHQVSDVNQLYLKLTEAGALNAI